MRDVVFIVLFLGAFAFGSCTEKSMSQKIAQDFCDCVIGNGFLNGQLPRYSLEDLMYNRTGQTPCLAEARERWLNILDPLSHKERADFTKELLLAFIETKCVHVALESFDANNSLGKWKELLPLPADQ